ncbi:spherulation-specific family 4 protein [Actinoplanes sp. TFC3]|uniref:spherulation-specific family 4 protein n=1 Tax=Actinoplanes sp. TFC3 TaxID=1710355 RepID=UPI00082C191A|nr:spherulation-specific family 4 protein [Actinoplanes sp. TFC3]
MRTALLSLAVAAAFVIAPDAASAQATTQHIAAPAYFGSASPYWSQVNQSSPGLGVVIANPNNGPGTAFDQGYANVIRAAANSGVRVIGYVDTGYFGTTGRTTRTGQTTTAAWTTQSEADIDSWYAMYGSYGLAGIFFDDGLPDCAHVSLYEAVNTYAKQHHPGAYTVDNPGTAADSCYASAADTIVMFEGTYATYTGWTAPAWELNSTNPDKFWHLVYATPNQSDMANAMALSKQRNAGYIYVTPDDLPNPWDTLPTGAYWADELARTNANGGDTTPPSTPGGLHSTTVGTTSVGLAWNASNDNNAVADYVVTANGTTVATVTGTSTTVGNLSPATAYTFTVIARDAARNSSPASSPLVITTKGGGTGTGCATSAGSGPITGISACRDAVSLKFKATFNTTVSLHHVFLNTDNNPATGYQLPSPSATRLGADYMIENNILYRSLSTGWSWAAVSGVSPNMVVSGATYSWTVPVSAFPSLASPQQAVFNGNTNYSTVLSY